MLIASLFKSFITTEAFILITTEKPIQIPVTFSTKIYVS